jgi:hypothetical protein
MEDESKDELTLDPFNPSFRITPRKPAEKTVNGLSLFGQVSSQQVNLIVVTASNAIK